MLAFCSNDTTFRHLSGRKVRALIPLPLSTSSKLRDTAASPKILLLRLGAGAIRRAAPLRFVLQTRHRNFFHAVCWTRADADNCAHCSRMFFSFAAHGSLLCPFCDFVSAHQCTNYSSRSAALFRPNGRTSIPFASYAYNRCASPYRNATLCVASSVRCTTTCYKNQRKKSVLC